MSGLSIVLWIAGFWVLIRLLPIFMAFLALLRLTMQPTAYRTVAEQEVDPELVSFLRTISLPLLRLGFVEVDFVRVRRALKSSDDQIDLLELLHAETQTYAAVGASEMPDRWSFSASFSTETEPPLLTMNGLAYALVGEYPGLEIFDPYAGTMEEAAKAHFARLHGRAGRPVSHVERLANGELRDRRYLESLVVAKDARHGREPDTYELTLKGAIGGARKILAARAGLRKMVIERRNFAAQHPELHPEPPLSEEVRAYRRHEDVRRSPNRRQTLAVIFGATAILFVLSMLQLFDAANLAVLVSVIFFHELGHYLAMRLFDYRDTTIFFIPFLGAAATGRKDRPSLTEEMIILLAGPMPGLVLGAALGFVPEIRSSEIGRSAILMLVSVNLFNLLPIFPLDGGRIVHALLFAGRPWLDAAFKLLAVGAFGGLGFVVGEGVLMVIALLIALTIPLGFRIARMEAEFRKEERVERPSDIVGWIFTRMRAEKPSPFGQKLAVARQLDQRLAHLPVRWWSAIPWMGAYGACIAGGVVAIALGSFPEVFAGEPQRIELSCPIDPEVIEGLAGARLFCAAPDEKTALSLQESLVLVEAGSGFCVPGPWEAALEPRQRRALLTLRIAQQRGPAELRNLIEERAGDPEFDRETVELMLGSDQEALAERVGRGDCDSTVYQVEREGLEVRFDVTGSIEEAATHLCKLGCEVVYQ